MRSITTSATNTTKPKKLVSFKARKGRSGKPEFRLKMFRPSLLELQQLISSDSFRKVTKVVKIIKKTRIKVKST